MGAAHRQLSADRVGVTKADVIAALAAGRSLTTGSAPWTLAFIDVADHQFDARWCRVAISGADARAVVLPPHEGEPCRGDTRLLVGTGGATVAATAAILTAVTEDYARDNPSCWSRLRAAEDAPLSPIILTTAPLARAEYATIVPAPGTLYHLDGLHRLVAWAMAGRLTDAARLTAFVAGV